MPAPNKLDDFWSFVAMVQDEDSCWLWKGTSDGRYGRFHYKQKKLKAHRLSWELANVAKAGSKHVLHTCDVTLCVRPKHLFLGTHTDNMRDMFAKNRRRILRGSQQHCAKLTEEKVKQIKDEYRNGARQVDLAERYGIYQTGISKIVNGKSWKHVS